MDHLHWQSLLATVTAVLALATLGSTTQIGSFLPTKVAKASKEGDIVLLHSRVGSWPHPQTLH
jgi:hypothetical protein